MNILYQSIVNIVVTQETIRRGGIDIQAPQLPALSKVGEALMENMVELQQLSDDPSNWLLAQDISKIEWNDRKRLGGLVLDIYIRAVQGADSRELDDGYDYVETAYLKELHDWLVSQFELTTEFKAGTEEGRVEMWENYTG